MPAQLSFIPADPPRESQLARWGDGAGTDRIDVVADPGVAPTGVDATMLAVAATDATASESAAYWRHAHRLALVLLAEGRVRPTVTAAGFAAWRVGGLDVARRLLIAETAAAMPAEARAIPIDAVDPPLLHSSHRLLRDYLDAVVDSVIGTNSISAEHLRQWTELAEHSEAEPLPLALRIDHDETSGTFALTVLVHDDGRVRSLDDVWTGTDPVVRARAMSALRDAERVWPTLGAVLDDHAPGSVVIGDADVSELLAGVAQQLGTLGVDIHWERHLLHTAVALHQRALHQGSCSTDESLGFEWRIVLDGSVLTEAETAELAAATRPLVRLRNSWVLAAPSTVQRAAQKQSETVSALSGVAAALTGTIEVDHAPVRVIDSAWLADLRQRLSAPVEPIAVPANLQATLRQYQEHGFAWLARMTAMGLGVCLADDMGLGKTVTVIALHLHRQLDADTAGPTLIVCPASLMGNWEREIRRFAPGTPVYRFHGAGRQVDSTTTGFVLTTYGTVVRSAPTAVTWQLMVADEAQYIKNPSSESARALRDVTARVRVALTGAPVENSLTDLWAILDWASPGLLGDRAQFRRTYARPIEERRDPIVTERLTRVIRPFVLRRRKSDPGIAPELPTKTVTDQVVSMTREQAGLYRAAVDEGLAAVAETTDITRRGQIMGLLTALKQICNHPAQYLRESDPVIEGRSEKLDLVDDLIDTIIAEDGAVLIFTQYVAMARLLERHLESRGVATLFLHGGTAVSERQALVDRFQAAAAPVFLLSLKAGGTGLNLMRADHVIHYDRWWNPAVEAQATDRAYRIGQTKPVQVHRMLTEGTIEDRIAAMIADKSDLADSVLSDEKSVIATLSGMSNDVLRDFIELKEQM
ncbi:DEAD/DEAH box helicase [Antrihabitans cavernicola]|uniref:ATP-dependent helicase n=1 Tax=Antrihabitans cavernicola TaxID=2495913 RepID=A0A5A7SGF8_9NOCA|nr:DEAD/DEAH box helicase [Spelaeibacter cavernicola]KAA0023555.1 ATP-dependent helicase [Spelaeibacter cavernicola]